MQCDQFQLVLATDLDGTFLEGTEQTRTFFYSKLFELQHKILLIYVTGRPIETVAEFCKLGYLPYAHFVMGDHGTHIVDGKSFLPIASLQEPIIAKWSNSNALLKELLLDEKGIQLQPIDPLYRVAYYYEANQLQQSTLQKINKAGFDSVLSCDMYLDILPRGVNKGSSLLASLNYLMIEHDKVITCGDSLNDLSLFQTGLKSIAVGNSEAKLVTAIQNLSNVYHSTFDGLLGIIDGLRFYDKFLWFEEVM